MKYFNAAADKDVSEMQYSEDSKNNSEDLKKKE